jgi:hypothetical protein
VKVFIITFSVAYCYFTPIRYKRQHSVLSSSVFISSLIVNDQFSCHTKSIGKIIVLYSFTFIDNMCEGKSLRIE